MTDYDFPHCLRVGARWQERHGSPVDAEKMRDAADRIEALEAALEPFSDMAGELFARHWDASRLVLALDNPDDPHRVTAGDFFATRRALQGEKQS